MPDFGFADFVEDFVAHVRVELTYDVLVTSLAEEIYGFIEMFFVDDTGVVGTSDEEDGHVGIIHCPIFLAVGLIHELEQSFETIKGEDETVALVGVVGGENGGIADDPGVGVTFVPETFHIAGEGEIVDEVAAMFFAFKYLEGFCNDNTYAGGELVAGRTADDEAVDVLVVFLDITAHDEGTHAVAEESEGKIGEAAADVLSDLVDVFDDGFGTVFAEIAEIVFGLNAGAVSAVVVNDDDETLLGAIIHEIMVAFAVLGHAVDELQDAGGVLGDADADAEV